MAGPQRPIFVLFGSSIVQYSYGHSGWGSILTNIYARKADIVVRGYSGWNTRRALQNLHQIFPKDAAVQPSLVIVYFGGNDSIEPHSSGLGPHVPLPEYTQNMRKIATHIQNLSPKTRTIFLTTPPINEEQVRQLSYFRQMVRTNDACRRYSEALVNLCREMDLEVVDLWTAIQKRDDWKDVCFTDGIHLTSEGSQIVVDEILKVLKEADWKPSLHWRSLPAEFGEASPYYAVSNTGKTTVNFSESTSHWEIQWD